MFYAEPNRKAMTPVQARYLTGKRVDSMKWIIPDGYGFCAITGKMLPESELLVTFAHHHFTREQRSLLGAWGVGWCEDADWLSEEGYEVIMTRVEVCGLMDVYQEGYWGPAPSEESVTESAPVITAVTAVNLDVLIGSTVQAMPMDDFLFRHETYVGTISEVKLNKHGTFVYFKTPDLVGGKWIKINRVIGFAHFAQTQKTAS